jgi:hypothetical protein
MLRGEMRMSTSSAGIQLAELRERPVSVQTQPAVREAWTDGQVARAVIAGLLGMATIAAFVGASLQMAGLWTP